MESLWNLRILRRFWSHEHLEAPQTSAFKAYAVTQRWSLLLQLEISKFLPAFLAGCAWFLLGACAAYAGGPRYVAGVSYFNPAVLGQPVSWSGGQVRYY